MSASPLTAADRECVRLVAALLGSSRDEVCSKSRHPLVTRARWACMVALRRRGLSFPQVGKALGGKDHSGVLHACEVAEARYAEDAAWLLAVEEGVRVGSREPRRRGPQADTSDPREACIGLLSTPGRVPPEACRAALVLLSLAAGLPVPVQTTPAAC